MMKEGSTMEINISVKSQYKILCPKSFSKCNSDRELEYKIWRCVQLGMQVECYMGGYKLFKYYNLTFIVKKNEILSVWKLDVDPYYVHESIKVKFDHTYKTKFLNNKQIPTLFKRIMMIFSIKKKKIGNL
jgi:hypothetical protein